MATIRKTITLTDAQDDWIKSQVTNGDYTNDSEYFRDLIRREQEKERALKIAIEEGLASGPSDRSLDDIFGPRLKRVTESRMAEYRLSRRAAADLEAIAEFTIQRFGLKSAPGVTATS